jgi:hypothetical protein
MSASVEPIGGDRSGPAVAAFREAQAALAYAGREAEADAMAWAADRIAGWSGTSADAARLVRIEADCTLEIVSRLTDGTRWMADNGWTNEARIISFFLPVFSNIVLSMALRRAIAASSSER